MNKERLNEIIKEEYDKFCKEHGGIHTPPRKLTVLMQAYGADENYKAVMEAKDQNDLTKALEKCVEVHGLAQVDEFLNYYKRIGQASNTGAFDHHAL